MIDAGDEALVVRSQAGDRAAFEQLVRRTARGVYAGLYVQVGDVHRTEDLVQETYLRAWKSIGSVSDAKTFRGWLYAIAGRVLLDAGKHESRQKRGRGAARPASDALESVADGGASVNDSLDHAEQRAAALEALRDLPEEYRQVLTLRYLAGADYDTIAQQLAITNGSLRGLLSRGMKMLRAKMKVEPQMSTDDHR
jgi:RNA polymerase sigma-70 factor (ECF subfamily)